MSTPRSSYRANIVPSNERPSFLPGYPYRVNPSSQQPTSQQRPSSAGTSRSRGGQQKSSSDNNGGGSGNGNIYIPGADNNANTAHYLQLVNIGGPAVPQQQRVPQPLANFNVAPAPGSSRQSPFMNITTPQLYVSNGNTLPVPSNSTSMGQQYNSSATSKTQQQQQQQQQQMQNNMYPLFPNAIVGPNSGATSSSAQRPRSAGATRGYDFNTGNAAMNNPNNFYLNSANKINTNNFSNSNGPMLNIPIATAPSAPASNGPQMSSGGNWQSYKLNFDNPHSGTNAGDKAPIHNHIIPPNSNGDNLKPNSNFIQSSSATRPASAGPTTSAVKIRQVVVESQQYNIDGNYNDSNNNSGANKPGPRPPENSSSHPSSANNPRTAAHVVVKPDAIHTIPKVAVADPNDVEDDEVGDMGLDAADIYDGSNKKAAVANTAVDDDDEMDGRPIQASRSQPEISIITASQSLDYGNVGSIGAPIDVRNSSIDSFAENDIDIGLSTVPNQFCTKRDALELRKLVVMTSQSRGGIVPSSSAVMDMYMVGKVIGVGSYGKVRAAWHRLTGAKIAIKTYDKAKMKDPSHWKRIYSEIKIMEQISHPRIARLYEAVETPKRMHLIMECSDGGNLCSYVKQKKRLSEEESKKIFFHIVQAIDYLHSLGVAHRDIKLENVLFTDQRDIKLIDFGFSTVCQPGKRLKVFCGTPSYMAPEIVNRVEYDGIPVDMWSLGILLYALLCGCFPFRAKTYPDLYRRIARGTFAIPDDLSAQAKDLIRQLLSADVSQRMNSHAALKHPWLHSQFSSAPDMDKLRKETPILISDRASDDMDEETLMEIEKYGISKEDIVKTVLTKTHSAIATLYYLLLDICVARRKKLTGSSKHRSSSDRHKSSNPYQNTNFNMYSNQQQNNYQYNPAYVLNNQELLQQQQQQQQQQHINMQQFQQANGPARPRSASATRSSNSGQRPLSANGTRR